MNAIKNDNNPKLEIINNYKFSTLSHLCSRDENQF